MSYDCDSVPDVPINPMCVSVTSMPSRFSHSLYVIWSLRYILSNLQILASYAIALYESLSGTH